MSGSVYKSDKGKKIVEQTYQKILNEYESYPFEQKIIVPFHTPSLIEPNFFSAEMLASRVASSFKMSHFSTGTERGVSSTKLANVS